MIVGLVGTAGSGKDSLAQYFVKKGFQHVSLSALLREEMALTPFKNLIEYGNVYRESLGPRALISLAIKKWKVLDHPVVFSSLRTEGEIRRCRYLPASVILYLECPEEERAKRIQNRGRLLNVERTKEQLLQEDKRIAGYKGRLTDAIVQMSEEPDNLGLHIHDLMCIFFGNGWEDHSREVG